MKVAETIALDKKHQKKITKQTAQLKKGIKSGRISIREDRRQQKLKAEQARGLVYIAHLPHGFYEEELKEYFKQFGRVTNVKVGRSKKNGNSKGFGYIEFAHPDVAKIAAETMNNYLMFKKRVVAEFVPYEKRPRNIFHGKQSTPEKYSALRRRERNNKCRNKEIDEEAHLKQSKQALTRLQKRLDLIKKLGFDYDLKPVDVPESLKSPEVVKSVKKTSDLKPVGVPKSLKSPKVVKTVKKVADLKSVSTPKSLKSPKVVKSVRKTPKK